MDGKNDMNKVNNKSNGNNSFPSQPNKFINNYKKNSSDSSNLKDTVQRGQQQNDLINKQNESLKKNISKQAVENPKESNIVKGKNSNTESNGLSKNMAVNKAKNLMNSIHSNKKKNNDDSNDTDSQDGKKESTADSLKKKIFSSFITASTGIPKPLADKFSSKAVDKSKIVSKILIYGGIFFVFIFIAAIASIISASGSEGGKDSEKENFSLFVSGEMADVDFYNYLASRNLVDGSCINQDDDTLNDNCPEMDFFKKINEKLGNENSSSKVEKMLIIYYAITYNRDDIDYSEINDSKELNDLLANKNDLKNYINGDYITNYRSDISTYPDFDLYAKISDGIISDDSSKNIAVSNYSACSSIVVEGIETAMSIDDYIAGVVAYEFNGEGNSESWKAFSIMLRTYIINLTDGCKNQFLPNKIQYNNNPSDEVKKSVNDSSKTILNDSNEALGTVSYSDFCYDCNEGNSDIYNDSSNFEEIIKKFYPNYELKKYGSSMGGPINGNYSNLFYYVSSDFKDAHKNYKASKIRNLKYYDGTVYISASTYQCPWWAKARALEMLDTITVADEEARKTVISYVKNSMGNGVDWYTLKTLENLPHSDDASQALPGAIVSWSWTYPYCTPGRIKQKWVKSDGTCYNFGHVGIVENVTYNDDGTVSKIYVSESGGTDGIYVHEYTSETIKKGWAGINGDYQFNGYVYLLN